MHVQAIKVAICLANAHTGRRTLPRGLGAQEGGRRRDAGWSADPDLSAPPWFSVINPILQTADESRPK